MNTTAIVRLVLGTAMVLAVPVVAMQFTDEVDWGPGDFVVAGVLVFGAGLTYQLAAPRVPSGTHRAAVAIAVLAALITVWAFLAVGIG